MDQGEIQWVSKEGRRGTANIIKVFACVRVGGEWWVWV